MIYLIQYDRKKGVIINIREFDEAERHKAEDARLTMEIDLRNTSIDYEVVLLEASSREALEKTHGRYFHDIKNLWETTSSQIQIKKL